MNIPALHTCPKCKQTDQIQKVTSAYGANTQEWTESHARPDAWGNLETVHERKEAHTSLGLKLKPPDKPAGPAHPGLWYGIVAFIVIVLGAVLCPIILLPLIFVILGLFGASVSLPSFMPDISGIPAWAIPVAALLCIVLPGLELAAWFGFKIKKRVQRDMKNYKDQKAAFDNDELRRWQRARERWEQLYYCMRDETVFIPAENKAIRADDMEKYLYDPLFRG